MDMSGGFGAIVVIFLFFLAILWFLLPFAVFGIKDKLSLLIAEQKKTNAELALIAGSIKTTTEGDKAVLPA